MLMERLPSDIREHIYELAIKEIYQKVVEEINKNFVYNSYYEMGVPIGRLDNLRLNTITQYILLTRALTIHTFSSGANRSIGTIKEISECKGIIIIDI